MTALITGVSGNLGQAVAKKFLQEGYLVAGTVLPDDRLPLNFPADKFENYVAKYVRKGHVQTSEHWLNEPMVKNELRTP